MAAAVHPKIAAAGAAGAVSVILVWVAELAGLAVPPEVASALTALLAFGAGYIRPGPPGPEPSARPDGPA
jgi:hypothetical protein